MSLETGVTSSNRQLSSVATGCNNTNVCNGFLGFLKPARFSVQLVTTDHDRKSGPEVAQKTGRRSQPKS